jgi:GGDEF domain-containing protein/chromate transport protein ChrA
MHPAAIGFWGAFFGCATLSLAGALLAFMRSAHRVALAGSLAALLSAAYAIVYLGWIPGASPEVLQRVRSVTAIVSAALLAVLLLLLLNTFRKADAQRRMRRVVAVLTVIAIALAWLLPAADAQQFAIVVTLVITAAAVGASAWSARRGERAGWLTLAALPCAATGEVGLDWYVYHPDNTPWPVHAMCAVVGIIYLLCIAIAMWSRYAYLIEVRKVMTHGPDFDPVTWMPSYEAGSVSVDASFGAEARPLGVIVVSISNLKMLEELHGRASYNHALFVCASRLKRQSLGGAELGRLREDGFVLLFRRLRDMQRLPEVARLITKRLSRPVVLATSREMTDLEDSEAMWEANVGVGVVVETGDMALDLVIAGARAMSRTAWSFPSRMAWYDEVTGAVAELPVAD